MSKGSNKSRKFDVQSLLSNSSTHSRSPSPSPPSSQGPDIVSSVGPPAPPAPPAPTFPPNLYPFLLNPGLFGNPLLNAHLALAAQQNSLLKTAAVNPFLMHAAERLRQHRFSPYPPMVSPSLSESLITSTASTGSAFTSVRSASNGSPSTSEHDTLQSRRKSDSTSPRPEKPDDIETNNSKEEADEDKEDSNKDVDQVNDIKSMEDLVNGLNGGSTSSKFGISHDSNREISI